MKPPPPTGMMGEIIGAAVGEAIAGSTFASSEWKYLLEEGSYVAVTIWGECIPKTGLDGPYGIAGVIPPPLPRMTPGVP
jgi:hypothetical protein